MLIGHPSEGKIMVFALRTNMICHESGLSQLYW